MRPDIADNHDNTTYGAAKFYHQERSLWFLTYLPDSSPYVVLRILEEHSKKLW